jgi:hypothetical protein
MNNQEGATTFCAGSHGGSLPRMPRHQWATRARLPITALPASLDGDYGAWGNDTDFLLLDGKATGPR